MTATTRKSEYADIPAGNVADLIELLRLDEGDEYNSELALLNSLLLVASDSAERYMNRALINCTWERVFTGEARPIGLASERETLKSFYLPYPPFIAVQEIKTIFGTIETELESGDYDIDTVSEPAVVILGRNLYPRERLYVKYTAGFGETADDLPEGIKQGVLQHSAYMYNHRGDCDADEALKKSGAELLYRPYRIGAI